MASSPEQDGRSGTGPRLEGVGAGVPGVTEVFVGGGELGALMRALDWSQTALGPVAGWPQSLRTTVSTCLDSRFPILILWGPELVKIYNDAYRQLLGNKHPRALGQAGRDCWPEIWHIIGPMLAGVLQDGRATWSENQLLLLERQGFAEECYFTFSYSPIRVESGGVGGVYCAVTETTRQVIGARRLRTLRDLGARTADAQATEEACRLAAEVLAGNPADLPFALIYLLDADGRRAHLAGAAGVASGVDPAPAVVELAVADAGKGWPLGAAARRGGARRLDDLEARFGPIPAGERAGPRSALVLPVAAPGSGLAAAVLVAGLSPRLALDDDYLGFVDLVAGQVATALASARALEQARQRAEALAELDRAKTTFFSNVSHEFRTPLTLLLGPAEEALADREHALPPVQRTRLELVHRNGLRLQKLVNTLLDVARIEAGRVQATFLPTDLAALTRDLASSFQAAMVQAGLDLVVHCPPLPRPVAVDPSMWEKIVLNLLSNAFKFTFQGRITVALTAADAPAAGEQDGDEDGDDNADAQVALEVSDTGAGIPAEELPHVFARFRRVEGAPGRSHEGSGIGLALVQELVKLHGGQVQVTSALGAGSTFRVTIPFAQPPRPEALAPSGTPTRSGPSAFLSEIGQWARGSDPPVETIGTSLRILVADDNADMRGYIARLLAPHAQVVAVADGAEALASARSDPPDLVLSDVMMPGMDGLALLRALRADPRTHLVPMILLSARAGEDDTVAGLNTGADAYLVKPFSARELIAQVKAQLAVSQLRRRALADERRNAEEAARQLLTSRRAQRGQDEMLALVTHDLRSPLAAIDASVQLLGHLVDDLPASDVNSRLRTPVARIQRSTQLMSRLIGDLLDSASEDATTFSISRRPEPVDALLRETLEAFEAQAHARGLTFSTRVERDLPPLPCDKDRLLQVLGNLVANALKFTPAGGAVEVLAGRNGGEVHFCVRDTGPGIPPHELGHVFDRTWQSRRVNPAGHGLGLSIARGIVESHGGHIEVSSEVGRGCTFTFQIPIDPPDDYDFLQGPGEVRALLRSRVWQGQSGLGRSETWPTSLRSSLGMILDSSFAMVVVWGPDFRYVYNDAFRPILGNKHPAALARPGAETFPEAWHTVLPLFEDTRQGKPVALEDVYIPLEKSGYLEDCYFTFSLSPIRDTAGSVTGTLTVVADTTGRVEGARRLATLRELALSAARALRESVEDACLAAAAALEKNRIDVPFALLYLHDATRAQARLVAGVGLEPGADASPTLVDLGDREGAAGWPLARVARSGRAEIVDDLGARFGPICAGPYPEPISTAVMLPLGRPGSEHAYGVLVVGLNPRRAVDALYSAFLDLLAEHITTAVSNARTIEEERRRVRGLAELDRVKTAFFSNVSHEFRTPLTLILGPIDDALSRPGGSLAGDDLDRVRRNALRLNKMVGTLLDFSRMEAGRAQATFVATDLAAFTADLASAFRSVIENAGLRLQVDCLPLGEAAYVDPEMWEKIVLNLLSNAVKYTQQGEIRVSLGREDDQVVLAVADSGVGIPADELPHVFERFYRVRVTKGRSHEGTGIGLALVQELVKVHGGNVEVSSTVGQGTTFTVRVPRGSAHLPRERVERAAAPRLPTSGEAAAFIEEASRWTIGPAPAPPPPSSIGVLDLRDEPARSRILVADDNADLRAYVSGLLEPVYTVKTASDGATALELARSGWPDLIVSDVMMPELDGFALVRALREDPRARGIPIILLSARAGEEATVEGLRTGADDYLVKPFSARELLARVRTQLQMARVRAQMWQERARADELSRSVAARDQFLTIASHELRTPLTALELHLESLLKAIAKGRIAAPNGQLTGRLEAALRQIDRLTRLIETLLDLSRISLGRLDLEYQELDLADLVGQVIQGCQGDAVAVGARFGVEASPAPGRWDRARLEQILNSILTTSLKYAPGSEIHVRVGGNTEQAFVVVRHSGVGIGNEDLARIFERFERAVAASHYGAMGVGLYLARKIVEAHGGTMQWDSSPDRGETFTIRLPTWRPDPSLIPPPDPPDQRNQRNDVRFELR